MPSWHIDIRKKEPAMPQERFKRKLTVILSADVEGYSRLMGDDEEATVRTLTSYREVMIDLIQQHNGNVLDSPGDNLLAEFASVVDAVQGAVAVQKEFKSRNDQMPENRRMRFRIGVNLGDVIEDKGRIYGDGVNIAARLEGLSEPGGICISRTAFDQIESKLPYGYEYLGDQPVKNIAKPIGAYRVLMEPGVSVSETRARVVSAEKAGPSSSGQPPPALRKSGKAWDYYPGGFVCLAAALGLPILGIFLERIGPGSFYALAGAGVLTGIVGIGLLLVGKLISRREEAAKNENDRM